MYAARLGLVVHSGQTQGVGVGVAAAAALAVFAVYVGRLKLKLTSPGPGFQYRVPALVVRVSSQVIGPAVLPSLNQPPAAHLSSTSLVVPAAWSLGLSL